MSLPIPPEAPDPKHGAGPAGDVVHAAEELVERAVTAAERSLARRVGERGLRALLWTLRLTWMLIVLAYFAFGSTVLLTRYYLLPHIDEWRTQIESAATAALHARVSVGRIEADWQGLRPRLRLSDVVLTDANGATVLALPQVEVVVGWTSVIALRPHTHLLTVFSPQVEVRRLRDRRFTVAGLLIDPHAPQTDTAFLDWVLAQHDIQVRDARVHFVDELAGAPQEASSREPESAAAPEAPAPSALEAAALDFTEVNFVLRRSLGGHRFAVQLRPPAQLSGLVDLRGEFSHPWNEPTSRMAAWSGRVFVQFEYADLARIDDLTHLVPEPAQIQRASGALRAWIDFSALQVTRLRADVALTDVAARLRPDLQPLRLDRVQGRITQTLRSSDTGQTQELELAGLRLEGPDELRLPPTDLLFRNTRLYRPDPSGATEYSRLEASHIVLSDWSRLAAQLPLPVDWLTTIERTAARGTLDDLRAAWDGPQTPPRAFALRARFAQLGFVVDSHRAASESDREAPAASDSGDAQTAPAPRRYEFTNLAGAIDFDQNAGSLRLDSSKAQLHLPFLYEEAPVALDTLSARVRWSGGAASSLNIDVDSLVAANDDLEVSAAGSWRAAGTAPPRLDVSGRVGRAKVNAVPRYLPAVVPASVRNWLQGALVDGRVSEATFYLRGDPKHFPFVDPSQGEFHVGVRVIDGKLDIVPAQPEQSNASQPGQSQGVQRWPLLAGIDADVNFDRNRLAINARRAKAYGYELSGITVRLPQLDRPGQHLLIEGQGAGSLGEMLRYVGDSPVNVWTGGWLASAQASGPARLQMKLEIPLDRAADTTVAGRVHFQSDNLVLRPDVAPFSAVSGELGFTQRGVQLSGITAGFLGGEVLVNGDTGPDGTVVIEGNGKATPQGISARPQTPAALGRLLDHTRGVLRYDAKVSVHDRNFDVRIDSDLVGLAADLPEPFGKAAAEPRALHVESVPLPGSLPQRDTQRASLGNALKAEIRRVADPNGAMRVERGVIAVGAMATVPDAGLLLLIDQPRLDVDRWQQLLGVDSNAPGSAPVPTAGSALVSPPGSAVQSRPAYGLDAIDLVTVHAGTLTLDNKSISNVSLSARRDPEQGWHIDIDSDQASGTLQWTGGTAAAPGRLTARLVKLTIPEGEKKEVTQLLEKPPTQFPALDIVADQFELGASNFGQLQVQAQNTGAAGVETWHLENLRISNRDGTLTAHGDWQPQTNSGSRKMFLHVDLAYDNAGELLGRFGLPGTIKNGKGKINGELAWVGSPFAIDYPSLTGKIHMATEKGQFLKVDTGAGRLLSVLSLQSLLHHVTGDFRDVFAQGFAFDTLSADASINDGVLTTDNFIMKGVNAVVRIKGSADLSAETQDLEVVVIPEINAGTASLAYALINPAIGLGTFVANFLLRKPLSAAFTNIYEVTGSWSDPKVERVKAESGAANTRPAS